jgi:hypothetical protein
LPSRDDVFRVDIREIASFYLLFMAIIIVVYYLPNIINQLFFLIILYSVFNSKKNYFWLALTFLLINQLGTLFKGDWIGGAMKNIASFNIAPSITFSFVDLFIIVLFIKAIRTKRKSKLFVKKPLIILLIYLIFLFLIFIMTETNFKLIILYLRYFFTFTLFYSIPILITKRNEYYRLAHLLLPAVFFIVLTQFYTIFTGRFFISLFRFFPIEGTNRPSGLKGTEVFMILLLASFLLQQRDHKENRIYLTIVQGLCFFSFFISQTRSWIIVCLVFFLYYIFKIDKDIARNIIILVTIIFISLIITQFSPKITSGYSLSMQRLSTLGQLASGKTEYREAGFSEGRITVRLPIVLRAFSINPVIGVGFGDSFQSLGEQFGDYHVGNFNLLANCGILGFILFCYLWIKYFATINRIIRKLSKNNRLRKGLSVLSIFFVCLLIQHFTSYQIFGYTVAPNTTIFLVIFICLTDKVLRDSIVENDGCATKIKHGVQ